MKNKNYGRAGSLAKVGAALLAVWLLLCTLTVGASAEGIDYPAGTASTRVFRGESEILAGECVIIDSITYVPLRDFCELFADCQITWNGNTQTATVKTANLTLTAQSNAIYITANGHHFYTVGKILNLNGHLHVPIRPLAKAFALDVSWNAAQRSVALTDRGNVRAVKTASYNEDDLYWLSRIISAEAKGEPLLGQIAVGNVVLNRVRSKSYPNTIYGVIFDRKYGTQFSPVSFGTIYQKPTASAVIAAKICLEGYSLSDEVLFFLNPRIATNNWIVRARPYAFTIGNHDFYK